MRLSQTKIALYISLVFICGALLGAFGYRLYTAASVDANAEPRKPASFRAQYLAEMQEKLNLTDEQFTKVGQILDETRERMNEVNRRTEPEIIKIRDEQIDKIRAILTPEQRPGYEQMRRERDDRAKAKAKAKADAARANDQH